MPTPHAKRNFRHAAARAASEPGRAYWAQLAAPDTPVPQVVRPSDVARLRDLSRQVLGAAVFAEQHGVPVSVHDHDDEQPCPACGLLELLNP